MCSWQSASWASCSGEAAVHVAEGSLKIYGFDFQGVFLTNGRAGSRNSAVITGRGGDNAIPHAHPIVDLIM